MIPEVKVLFLSQGNNGGFKNGAAQNRKAYRKKRKEQNLTQEQLAELLGVSNKTISKWETGKCMPDYAVVKSLCEELKVSVSELMDGEEADDKSVRVYDDEQILDLLRRTQELEKQKGMMTGVILIVMGIAFQALSHTLGGSDVKDFFSGLLMGLSVAEMVLGVYITAKGASGKEGSPLFCLKCRQITRLNAAKFHTSAIKSPTKTCRADNPQPTGQRVIGSLPLTTAAHSVLSVCFHLTGFRTKQGIPSS